MHKPMVVWVLVPSGFCPVYPCLVPGWASGSAGSLLRSFLGPSVLTCTRGPLGSKGITLQGVRHGLRAGLCPRISCAWQRDWAWPAAACESPLWGELRRVGFVLSGAVGGDNDDAGAEEVRRGAQR